MAAPANELQAAIYSALMANVELSAIVGDRIYDRVPMAGDQAPFVTIGAGTERPDLNDCKDLSNHTIVVNVWSEEQGGFKQSKEISYLVKSTLDADALSLVDHALIDINLQDAIYQRDPDGITSHAILRFEAMIEEN